MSGDTSYMLFGQWLKQRRKAFALTQGELADHVGCCGNAIRKIEAGDRRPSGQMAERLAEAFHVPADEQAAFVHFARAASGSSGSLATGEPAQNEEGEEAPPSSSPWLALRRRPGNMPMPSTGLIWREGEVGAARSQLLLARTHPLKLTGPAGIGKTRLALEVRAERQFLIAPLELPDLARLPGVEDLSRNPAVTMFVERARSIDATFELTEENAEAVAAICVRLEGLPLAIELAAAHITMFSPQEMLAWLDSRLKALTGGPRDVPERQQSLRWAKGGSDPEGAQAGLRLAGAL